MSEKEETLIRRKITHVLSVYPALSPSMLQVGIGNALPSSIWKPVLDGLIKEGIVEETHIVARTPSDRLQNYTKLSLANGHAQSEPETEDQTLNGEAA